MTMENGAKWLIFLKYRFAFAEIPHLLDKINAKLFTRANYTAERILHDNTTNAERA